MNKVFKKFFEIVAKIMAIILWSFTHPIVALKALLKSEKARPYIIAFCMTAIMLALCLSYGIREIHSTPFILGSATGIFFLLATTFKCMPNDDEFYHRVPYRKETKIFHSILLPLVIVLPCALYVAYHFPAPIPTVFGMIPAILPVSIVGIIIVIVWSLVNYRGYSKE